MVFNECLLDLWNLFNSHRNCKGVTMKGYEVRFNDTNDKNQYDFKLFVEAELAEAYRLEVLKGRKFSWIRVVETGYCPSCHKLTHRSTLEAMSECMRCDAMRQEMFEDEEVEKGL